MNSLSRSTDDGWRLLAFVIYVGIGTCVVAPVAIVIGLGWLSLHALRIV